MKTPSVQKLRLLYIIDILSKKSDEEHPMSATQIMEYLQNDYGIECERKTIYDCIECLDDNTKDMTLDEEFLLTDKFGEIFLKLKTLTNANTQGINKSFILLFYLIPR